MEFLLELQWPDPVARAVARILTALPDGVEPTTGSLPPGMSRGFEVVRADSPATLAALVDAIIGCGAEVRVIGEGVAEDRHAFAEASQA
jgi:hypothetical protein